MANDNELEQMKQKYASILTTIEQQKIRLSHINMQDKKLFIQGVAGSEQAKNKVWEKIKEVDSNWAQTLTVDITVDPNAQPQSASVPGSQPRTYTVKAGDSLSQISKEIYGNANEYMKIFEANRGLLSDPNKISPGQTLKIPG